MFGTFPALASRVDLVGALKSGGKGTSDAGGGRRAAERADRRAGGGVGRAAGRRRPAASELLSPAERRSRLPRRPRDVGARSSATSPSIPMRSRCAGSTCRCSSGSRARPVSSRPPVTNARAAGGSAAGPDAVSDAADGPTTRRRRGRPRTCASRAPKYFDTLGIPMRRGRGFTELDHENAAPVVIINETMARRRVGGPRPDRHRRSRPTTARTWATVVGVVGDVKTFGLDRDCGGAGLHAAAAVGRPRRPRAGADDRRSHRRRRRSFATPCTASIPTCRSKTCGRSTRFATPRSRRRG